MKRAWYICFCLWGYCIQVITCHTLCKYFYVEPNRSTVCSTTGNNNYTCGNLQKAFLFLGTDSDNDTCSVITITPGEHILTKPFTLNHDVTLRGFGHQSKITFRHIISSSSTNLDPVPVLTFRNNDYISINSLTFADSPGFINIDNVTKVIITNTTFRLFEQGAVHVYNFHQLTVIGCIFGSNGPASFLKRDNFRGHSGGLSVSLYNYTSSYPTHEIEIRDTIFVNNSAMPNQEVQRTTSQVFNTFLFTGRGGGLGFFLSDTSSIIMALVYNCTFERNFALTWGGGIYVVLDYISNHTVTIKDSSFLLNHCDNGAGAFFTGFFGSGTPGLHSIIKIMRTNFTMNNADHGGAIKISLPSQQGQTTSNAAIFDNCTFIKNSAQEFGSAISLSTLDPFRQVENSNPSKIINCSFVQNAGKLSGCVTIVFLPVSFEGHNMFDHNLGSAITVAGSLLYIHDNLHFSNQVATGIPQAAISITSFGQLLLHSHTRISFINNTGIIGAAISVESQKITAHLKNLFYNPLCFLVYENPLVPPNNWTDVEMYFEGNIASEASVAMTNLLDLCSWVSTKSPYFNATSVLKWNFIKFGNNTNSFHDDKDNPRYYIQSDPVKLKLENDQLEVYPGELFNINVTITDELNKSLGGIVRLEGQFSTTNSQSDVVFEPAVSVYQQENELIQTMILQNPALENRTQKIVAAELFASEIAVGSMDIHIKDCPPGYILRNTMIGERSLQICDCNSIGNSKILTCDGNNAFLAGQLWATNDSAQLDSLYVYPCPMGYCQCELYASKEYTCVHRYNNAKQDIQCSLDRKGVLCGECRNSSFGVSVLLNKCVTCSDSSGSLIAVLVIIDIVIFTLMLTVFWSIRFPAWFYPCTFYIQVLPYFTENFDEGFIVLRPYLYYIASGLGFYFPYDFCLYSNMSALASYTIRFLPLLTAIIICPTIILTRKLLMKNSRWLLLKRNYNKPWYSVWLIILLVYTHAVHTAMSILNCPTVPLNNTRTGQWYVAGQVTCFTGGHIVLAVIALIVLLMATLLIFLSFVAFIYEFKNIKLKVAIVGIKTHFKEGFTWWYTVEIGRRLLILLLIVPFPLNSFPSLLLLAVLLVFFVYIKPYKSSAANIAELILSVDIIMLGLIKTIHENGVQVEVSVSTSTSNKGTIITFNAWWWALFYYLPVVVTLFLIILSLIKYVRNKWLQNKRLKEATITGQRSSDTKSISPQNKFELTASHNFYMLNSIPITDNLKNKEINTDHDFDGTV